MASRKNATVSSCLKAEFDSNGGLLRPAPPAETLSRCYAEADVGRLEAGPAQGLRRYSAH